ncbi:unnamed protein product [Euphydryas editha]|uniref:DUF4817 domain-containing protein n=1 Tax=Euphydryas editha TaxID=104508 RepID=A0AAU9TQA2_EUPED|nr:unnamed protein product [Euphydryas editha]
MERFTGKQRAFCVKMFYKNNDSYVTVRRLFRIEYGLQRIIHIKYSSNKELTIGSFYSRTNCSPFSRSKLDRLIKSLPESIFDFNSLNLAWGCSIYNCGGKDILESINNNNSIILNDGSMTTVGSHIWRQDALDLTIVSLSLALV